MPLRLGLDTSTLMLSLALVERSASGALNVLERVDEGPPRKQSEMLPALVGELLGRHGVALAQLEGICVGMGPGSFTGLRIGLASVKALAYASRVRVGGASSLAALAQDGPEGCLLLPCGLARQGELYVGHYRREGASLVPVGKEDVMTTEELAALLRSEPDARVMGAGLNAEEAKLLALGVGPEQLLPTLRHPSAVAVVALASLPPTFELPALFALEPHYLRASEPERNPKFPPLPGPTPVARIKD